MGCVMKFPTVFVVCLSLAAPLWADAPKVATDIAPVHSLVAQVMQGVGVPALILAPDASPHDHAMRPSEARALAQSDVVIWMGPSLTPWLAKSIETLASGAVQVPLQDHAPTVLEFREGAHFGAHDHGDEDAEGEEGDHHEIDPHMWLDPQNAQVWIAEIARILGAQDSENAEKYESNSKVAIKSLQQLEMQTSNRLSGLTSRSYVVLHDAFQYFEMRFGVVAAGAISGSDAEAPSPKRLKDIEHVIKDTSAACVLAQPQFNPKLVTAIARNTPVQAADPMGFGIALGPNFYREMMTALAGAFEACLSQ